MGIFRWIGDLFRRRDAADWAAEARGLLAKGKPARALADIARLPSEKPHPLEALFP